MRIPPMAGWRKATGLRQRRKGADRRTSALGARWNVFTQLSKYAAEPVTVMCLLRAGFPRPRVGMLGRVGTRPASFDLIVFAWPLRTVRDRRHTHPTERKQVADG